MLLKVSYSLCFFSFSILGYLFLPYIDGPCAINAPYNIGIYANEHSVEGHQGIIINTPYRFEMDGEVVNGFYQHTINKLDIEYINRSNIDKNISLMCKSIHVCINLIGGRIYEKLYYVLKYEKRRQQCYSAYGILKNMMWSTRSSISTWSKIQFNKKSKHKLMIIENVSNLDESIKMFMYVHDRDSWENGYEESRCVGMKQVMVQQVEFHNVISYERIFSWSVVACAFLFTFLKKIINYIFNTFMVLVNENNNNGDETLSNTVHFINFNGITMVKFIASLILLLSHSYAFTNNNNREPLKRNFRFRHSIANMMLCVQLCLSGFLCQNSSARILVKNSPITQEDKKNCIIANYSNVDIWSSSVFIFVNRCGRLLKQHVLCVVTCTLVIYVVTCLTLTKDENDLTTCTTSDIKFQRSFLAYFYSNVFEHPLFAIFPKPLLMPTQTLGDFFQGNAINDSLWTIPHQIFCYMMFFFVDTLSYFNHSSGMKFETLIFLYTSFFALRAVQFTDDGQLNHGMIPKGNTEWYGHHGRFAIYSDFLLGGLLYHIFHRIHKITLQCQLQIYDLNLYLSLTPLLIIPWFLRHSAMFAIFYSPLISVFVVMISQNIKFDNKNQLFALLDKHVLQSSNMIYFFGAPLQKALFYYMNIDSVTMVFVITSIVCIVLHNLIFFWRGCCNFVSLNTKKINLSSLKIKKQ